MVAYIWLVCINTHLHQVWLGYGPQGAIAHEAECGINIWLEEAVLVVERHLLSYGSEHVLERRRGREALLVQQLDALARRQQLDAKHTLDIAEELQALAWPVSV